MVWFDYDYDIKTYPTIVKQEGSTHSCSL